MKVDTRSRAPGDVVDLSGRIKKGGELVGDFKVSGKKAALPDLVEAVVARVQEMVK